MARIPNNPNLKRVAATILGAPRRNPLPPMQNRQDIQKLVKSGKIKRTIKKMAESYDPKIYKVDPEFEKVARQQRHDIVRRLLESPNVSKQSKLVFLHALYVEHNDLIPLAFYRPEHLNTTQDLQNIDICIIEIMRELGRFEKEIILSYRKSEKDGSEPERQEPLHINQALNVNLFEHGAASEDIAKAFVEFEQILNNATHRDVEAEHGEPMIDFPESENYALRLKEYAQYRPEDFLAEEQAYRNSEEFTEIKQALQEYSETIKTEVGELVFSDGFIVSTRKLNTLQRARLVMNIHLMFQSTLVLQFLLGAVLRRHKHTSIALDHITNPAKLAKIREAAIGTSTNDLNYLSHLADMTATYAENLLRYNANYDYARVMRNIENHLFVVSATYEKYVEIGLVDELYRFKNNSVQFFQALNFISIPEAELLDKSLANYPSILSPRVAQTTLAMFDTVIPQGISLMTAELLAFSKLQKFREQNFDQFLDNHLLNLAKELAARDNISLEQAQEQINSKVTPESEVNSKTLTQLINVLNKREREKDKDKSETRTHHALEHLAIAEAKFCTYELSSYSPNHRRESTLNSYWFKVIRLYMWNDKLFNLVEPELVEDFAKAYPKEFKVLQQANGEQLANELQKFLDVIDKQVHPLRRRLDGKKRLSTATPKPSQPGSGFIAEKPVLAYDLTLNDLIEEVQYRAKQIRYHIKTNGEQGDSRLALIAKRETLAHQRKLEAINERIARLQAEVERLKQQSPNQRLKPEELIDIRPQDAKSARLPAKKRKGKKNPAVSAVQKQLQDEINYLRNYVNREEESQRNQLAEKLGVTVADLPDLSWNKISELTYVNPLSIDRITAPSLVRKKIREYQKALADYNSAEAEALRKEAQEAVIFMVTKFMQKEPEIRQVNAELIRDLPGKLNGNKLSDTIMQFTTGNFKEILFKLIAISDSYYRGPLLKAISEPKDKEQENTPSPVVDIAALKAAKREKQKQIPVVVPKIDPQKIKAKKRR